MKNDILSITIVTIIYLIVWFLIIKIRNSRCEIIKDFDNGNDFYKSLSELDKENYWKEDTKILNIFFLILLFFVEFAIFLLFIENKMWFLSLIIGIIISVITGIILSIKLKRKYK